ncbi:NTPase [Sulfodiicoccus acidiphilus]|uniref:Nucleoside-triphosphatase GCM10007116_12420 n=1 Tax=Sulfodiicoccus acidiphilus TaxID=1670455 RepID=A0A348B6P3_9CREN|nr:nucleoside-triphosphatase [Sulfodiicoccus acidiphilus]BBD73845.1 NTPase [Sulfodiicoccus acidiphilus]GGT96361.1 NTPase [Sulfodiicoccus acidiphilus]
MKLKTLLTGRPGVGKTTVILNVVQTMRGEAKFGGFLTPEVREKGRRVGFRIVDVLTGESVWLAREGGNSVGRYSLFQDAGELGLFAVRRALREADVLVLDEVGPMELKVPKLREAIVEALSSTMPVIGAVHRNVQLDVKYERIVVTENNRASLTSLLVARLREALGSRS